MSDYTPTGIPAAQTRGLSSQPKAEFVLIQVAIATKANIASPAFTGSVTFAGAVAFSVTPTAPTPTTGDNTTSLATTAFVTNTVMNSQLPAQAGNAGKFIQSDGVNASWASPNPVWVRKTSAYGAASWDNIKASTTGGAWSLTFPATPADGDEIEVQDVDGTFNTTNLTILPNGKKVMGFTTSLILDTRYLHVVFVYDATLGDWRI